MCQAEIIFFPKKGRQTSLFVLTHKKEREKLLKENPNAFKYDEVFEERKTQALKEKSKRNGSLYIDSLKVSAKQREYM